MLTWKQIKQVIEQAHPAHSVDDSTRLTYLMVHANNISFGLVGQDGFCAEINNIHGWVKPDKTQSPAVPVNQPALG